MSARPPLLLVTGFGAFERVAENPSGALARALAADPPPGARLVAVELPVAFRGSAAGLDARLASLGEAPDAFLSLGVHPGASFRLERRARARLGSGRPDVEGTCGDELLLEGPPALETSFLLEPLADRLRIAGAPLVELSDDAGGYVCERLYRHALELGARLARPALFLHVPPLDVLSLERQLGPVRALVAELAELVRAGGLRTAGPRPRG